MELRNGRLENAYEAAKRADAILSNDFTLYAICNCFNSAHNMSFTRQNIMSGFSKISIWPFKPEIVLSLQLSHSGDDIERIMDPLC